MFTKDTRKCTRKINSASRKAETSWLIYIYGYGQAGPSREWDDQFQCWFSFYITRLCSWKLKIPRASHQSQFLWIQYSNIYFKFMCRSLWHKPSIFWKIQEIAKGGSELRLRVVEYVIYTQRSNFFSRLEIP